MTQRSKVKQLQQMKNEEQFAPFRETLSELEMLAKVGKFIVCEFIVNTVEIYLQISCCKWSTKFSV